MRNASLRPTRRVAVQRGRLPAAIVPARHGGYAACKIHCRQLP